MKTRSRLLLKLLYLLLALSLVAALFTEGKTKAMLLFAMGIILVVVGITQIFLTIFIRKE